MKKYILGLLIFSIGHSSLWAQTWDDRPTQTLNTVYDQDFTTNQWDETFFYNYWETVDPNIFSASDIENGYLQFQWISKRIIRSKNTLVPPYILVAEIGYGNGSHRGGIVIRVDNNQGERVQEPAEGDPGFNSEGIALYPTENGESLIVQFTGAYETNNTPVTRIEVPKPAGIASLKHQNTFRI
ncbi:hypothetical protein [Marinoscillum furvescens]|uniref:Uncharacterized protein n=1 Tax=Marinoscillum furvescens DSM 4134 TaxID=1122208 RepID=A0A3D9L1W2_MARFU|nr:hypothetical protein [Marinoscillum furvescens]RED98342.1 hypothetical protein C7460_11012 [Marinoscillum furvescens DSM 4134]